MTITKRKEQNSFTSGAYGFTILAVNRTGEWVKVRRESDGALREWRISNLRADTVEELPAGTSCAKTYRHQCPDWDFMVIDRNSAELVGCSCFDDPEFLAVREQHSQALDRINETL